MESPVHPAPASANSLSTPRKRSFTAKRKLEIVQYSETHSIRDTNREFGVDRKCVKSWIKQREDLERLCQGSTPKRKRLEGGGRKPDERIDEAAYEYFMKCRVQKLRVTRKRLQQKALEAYNKLVAAEEALPNGFTASRGWLANFMRRQNLSLRKTTTVCQKLPADYIPKIVDFVLYVRSLVQEHNLAPGDIIACDETAVWLDCLSNATVEQKGAKEVSVLSTGHEKMCVTVMLTGRGDGTKMKPFVLIDRKRPLTHLVKQFKNLTLSFSGTTWMNQSLICDYVRSVIGRRLFRKRLLVWDSFNPHISVETKSLLRKSYVLRAVVPGGTTKYLQAPDVSWNKPFKDHVRECYDAWQESGVKELTVHGNPKPPPLEEVLKWISTSWDTSCRGI